MAAASNDVSSGQDTLPKWKVALAVGGGVALVAGGIWYYNRRKGNSKNTKPENGKNTRSENPSQSASPPETPQTELSPLEQAQAEKNKGNKYFKGGRYDQAIQCYTKAIKICPSGNNQDLSTFYQNRAAAYEKLKSFKLVVEDCSMALELNRKYTKAYARRANACEQTGYLGQALEDVTALCILEGFANPMSLQTADRLLKTLGQTKAKQSFKERKPGMPSKHYIRTYRASFMNDPVLNAVRDLDETQVQNGGADIPDMSSPYYIALRKLKSEEYDDIISLCTQEIESTKSVEARLLRGTFYYLICLIDKAIEDFDVILSEEKLDKKVHVNVLIKKGTILMQQEKNTEGLDHFAKAVRIDPDNADIYHHRGHHNIQLDRLDEAIRDLENSISKCPAFAASHVQKSFAEHKKAAAGLAGTSLPLPQTVLISYKQNVDMFPDYSDARALYAQALGDAGKFDEADREFEKAIELDADNSTAFVHRGLLRLQWKQDVNDAMSMINKAIDMDSKCEYAYEVLGTLEVQRGNMDKAMEYFERAIGLARTESEMAHLYSLLDAAKAQLQVAKNLGIQMPSAIGSQVPM
ncbi:hypothetical protein KUTeg_006361 [Tegillarca granosa]|uniref:Mitochondrial import receptor subunit TOM70 n=1 Tax=Tegillarca granosa TaxID=220873 RepID=A0ABQ9FK84_TEGGR|nr:hypothetical protein KUTeg_006361 [Tegillarca granosa]